jgi:hypothetical protein
MSLLEDFAKAIEQGDSNQIDLLLVNGSIDINARLPRQNNPPHSCLLHRRVVPTLLNGF